MLDLVTEASPLGTLLEDTRGVVGVVLGTVEGEVRAIVGSVVDSDATGVVAATLVAELSKIGRLLGLGELGVASIKAATAARVFAQQSGTVVTIELDPKRPIGELETKLRTVAWAPDEEILQPVVNRVPTVPNTERPRGATRPPPLPPPLPPPPGATRPPPPAGLGRLGSPTVPPPMAGSVAAQAKSVGSGPVFTGDLEEFCLPDLLEFLRNSHRTGLLMCTSDRGVGRIQLSRGMIIGAESPNALDLRAHFIASPALTPDQRRVLAGLPLECFSDEAIVDELASRELAPRDEVERARIERIYSAFREMMAWTSGRFSFDPAVPIATNPALALSTQTILMQIFQEQDEQGR